jgi:hypothetical protein
VQQKSCSFGAVPQSFAACSCSNCAVAFLRDYMIKRHINPTVRQKSAAATDFEFRERKILLIIDKLRKSTRNRAKSLNRTSTNLSRLRWTLFYHVYHESAGIRDLSSFCLLPVSSCHPCVLLLSLNMDEHTHPFRLQGEGKALLDKIILIPEEIDPTFARTTFAQRHLHRDICPETFAQNNICPEEICPERHLPRKTFARMDICPYDVCPEGVCPEKHLIRKTFAQKTFTQADVSPEGGLLRKTFAQKTFAQKDICPERYLPRKTFVQKDICPQGHLP